MMFT